MKQKLNQTETKIKDTKIDRIKRKIQFQQIIKPSKANKAKMKGIMSGIFGTSSSQSTAKKNDQKPPGAAPQVPQGVNDVGGQKKDQSFEEIKKEESQEAQNVPASFTTSSGFNLPGLSVVNQAHVQPSCPAPVQPQVPSYDAAKQQPQASSSGNSLPGLFAGIDLGKGAQNNTDTKNMDASNKTNQTTEPNKQAQLPGLFAGLGLSFNQPAPAPAAPSQPDKLAEAAQQQNTQPQESQQATNNSAASQFDLFSQLNLMTSQTPPNQNDTQGSSDQKPGFIPSNPYTGAASDQQNEMKGMFAGLGTSQAPGAQVPQPQTNKTNAFGLDMFAGLTPSQPNQTAQADPLPKSDKQTPEQKQQEGASQEPQRAASAFDFMAAFSKPSPPQPTAPAAAINTTGNTAATNVTNTSNEIAEQQNESKQISGGLQGLGLFAGMDLMAGTTNMSSGRIDSIGKQQTAQVDELNENNQQPTEISIIDNANGDNSKNQISFEEMNLNLGAASGPGAQDGNSGVLAGLESSPESKRHQVNPDPQAEDYAPPTLVPPAGASGCPASAQQQQQAPQPQSSLFAFMQVKQPESATSNLLDLGTPHIIPSHPSQLQSNENEPFNAQDISNEDLLMMPDSNRPDGNSMNSANDDQEENFEEILESREIIEDKIFSIKCRMIDFTVRQWEISEKIKALNSDISILQSKIEDTQNEQAQAIENEDYEKADNLDIRIKQTRKLVEAKAYQIKQMRENNVSQEVMKADKHQELSELMHKSISKVDAIRERQSMEKKQYEDTETVAIEEKKKRLHYESIRISEETKSLDEEKHAYDKGLAKIEDKVYADTKEQHAEKHKLDQMIDDLNREVEELMRVLERKRKEKEMLQLEKGVHEKKIASARMIYQDDINTAQNKLDKVNQKLTQIEKDDQQWKEEKQDLDDYEDHFKAQIKNFNEEFKKLDEMQRYLEYNSVEIDQINIERKEIRNKQIGIVNQIQSLASEKKQIVQGQEFIQERLAKLELELDEFETQVSSNKKKLTKLELEKKKFAAAKKFKDAGKCQAEIKDLQQKLEHWTEQIQKTQDHRQQLEQDLEAQNKQVSEIASKEIELSEQNERTQLIILTYRKDEILDLIGSVNRILTQIEIKGIDSLRRASGVSGSHSKPKLSPEELTNKLETLQSDLTAIDEELFELEKRYGEYKRPSIKRDVIKAKKEVQEEAEVQVAEEEATSVKSEKSNQSKEESAHQIEEDLKVVEKQSSEQPKKEESGVSKPDAATMRQFIAEYEQKCKDLEEAVDQEAGAENYEEAEKLQEDFEKYMAQNQDKVEEYKILLEQITEEDNKEEEQIEQINEEEQIEENNSENKEGKDKVSDQKSAEEEPVSEKNDEEPVAEKKEEDSATVEAPQQQEEQKPSMFAFMQVKEQQEEANVDAIQDEIDQEISNENKKEENENNTTEQNNNQPETQPASSAFGFMSGSLPEVPQYDTQELPQMPQYDNDDDEQKSLDADQNSNQADLSDEKQLSADKDNEQNLSADNEKQEQEIEENQEIKKNELDEEIPVGDPVKEAENEQELTEQQREEIEQIQADEDNQQQEPENDSQPPAFSFMQPTAAVQEENKQDQQPTSGFSFMDNNANNETDINETNTQQIQQEASNEGGEQPSTENQSPQKSGFAFM